MYYIILYCIYYYPINLVCIFKKDRKVVDPDLKEGGEELGGAEGEKTIILYTCEKINTIFSIKGKRFSFLF